MSLFLFMLTFKKARLHVSLAYKFSLVVSTLMYVALFFFGSKAPFLLIFSYGLVYCQNYIEMEYAFQLMYPVHLVNVMMA